MEPTMTRPIRNLGSLASLAALVASGCTVGPDYARPDLTHPQEFRGAAGAPDAASFADLPWWDVFNDPALRTLIAEGLTNNYDLAVATARIEQARALVGVARSEGLPQIGYEVVAGAQKSFVPEQDNIGTTTYTAVSGALNAAWELDLWGRIRRSTEAARANLFAQEEVRRAVMLTLVSDIATGYFRLLALDRELAIAEESGVAYGKIRDLFTLRFKAGRDSGLPSERAISAYSSSEARIAELKQRIVQQENALSILVGGYPRAIPRGLPLTAQTTPPTPLGQTTDLLRRRPDIRRAEQEMIRANAQVGVAVANFYPRIGLGALLGGIWVNGENGFEDTFGFWRAGADITGPIFTGGRLESIYEERKAYWDETMANWRKLVTVAFQETSDALVAQQQLAQRRAALEAQVAALRRSVDIALTRYDSGRASYFEVLEAQQQLYPAEDQLAQTQQSQLVAVVNLYKALGGGWQLTDEQWAHPG
jgi:multidrug efflux system outer membrane protein